MKRLVLVGGGHAHLGVLKRLAARPIAGWAVTLISSSPRQIYSGMLPGWMAGHYTIDECSISLTDLATRAGVAFHAGSVTGLDLSEGKASCADGRLFAFDLLSLDVGSEPAIVNLPGAAAHALPVRPIDAFVAAWPGVVEGWKERAEAIEVCVIGSGAAAVELAFAIRQRAKADGIDGLHVTLVGRDPRPLAGFASPAVERVVRALRQAGIAWRGDSEVMQVAPGTLSVADGGSLRFDVCLLATGAAAPGWPKAAGLATDEHGFIRVDRTLRSLSDARVFAAGDIAALPSPRPKSGVFAVRAAAVLAHNLAAAAGMGAAREWRPQRHALYLLSTADGRAIAAWRMWSAIGRWIWHWKDGIDRRFVRSFRISAG